MAKKLYEISVHGCDDSTYIREALTDKQAELLKRVADRISDTAEEHCQPTMVVKEIQ